MVNNNISKKQAHGLSVNAKQPHTSPDITNHAVSVNEQHYKDISPDSHLDSDIQHFVHSEFNNLDSHSLIDMSTLSNVNDEYVKYAEGFQLVNEQKQASHKQKKQKKRTKRGKTATEEEVAPNQETLGNLDLCQDCNILNRDDSHNDNRFDLRSCSTEQLYALFDQKIEDLNNTWEKPLFIPDAKFFYHNLTGVQMVSIYEIYNNEKTMYKEDKINILSAVKQEDFDDPYLYFDPNKYPVQENPFQNDVWILLKNHIQASALASGYSVYSNGGSRKSVKLPHREFRCYKGKRYKKQSKLIDSFNQYRATNMINNRSRSRGRIGLKLPRRRGHHRPEKHTCHFNFTVCCDHFGYHIKNGRGTFTHRYHMNHYKTKHKIAARHLPTCIRKCISYMNNAHTNHGSMRNVIYKNTGTILSLQNIRYLCQKRKIIKLI